ncbi:MAG: lysine--tRNA ligase [Bryobacterales bacterium]|nr:lysine--tRNA ligase [Bryobacterales bacterium]
MSLEDRLFERRYQKIREIEALGFATYPRKFDYTHTAGEIRTNYGPLNGEDLEARAVQVRVCGRLMTVRRQGKAGFCHLQQQGERLQVYVRKDEVGNAAFELYKKLDAGDVIGVEGPLFRTRTGELTVRAHRLSFLAKALLPMPEKWHGLRDVEIRYRQRYLDLVTNDLVREVFVKREKIIQALRQALVERGYLEVETPMMQPIYGGALARPFQTHHNALDVDLYLRIAPELYLKRLIVGGLDRVFEINKNFRNEGLSIRHNPEFTMLEFYQAYSDYKDLMDLSAVLLRSAAEAANNGSPEVEFKGRKIDFSKLQRLSMKEAIVEFWPSDNTRPTPDDLNDPGRVTALVHIYNGTIDSTLPLPPNASPGDCIQALFEHACEENLIQPTLIYDYPVEASPLSKKKPDDPNWVERFEIYAGGMEVANAYSELNDPQEQRRRFEQQVDQRAQGEHEAHEMDEDYIRALCYGMPPTAGEGIGIDRLTMLLTDSHSIRDVVLFPLLRPEGEIGVAERLRGMDETTNNEEQYAG